MHVNFCLRDLGDNWGKFVAYLPQRDFPGLNASYNNQNACITLFQEVIKFINCVRETNNDRLSAKDKMKFSKYIQSLTALVTALQNGRNGRDISNRLSICQGDHVKIFHIRKIFNNCIPPCAYTDVRRINEVIFTA